MSTPKQHYQTSLMKNTCSCLGWKYQRKPPHLRSCKHLRQLGQEPSAQNAPYEYRAMDPALPPTPMLVAQSPPLTPLNPKEYLFSRKYDGIRVWFDGELLTTRNGVILTGAPKKLRLLSLPPLPHEIAVLDGELVHRTIDSHYAVMESVNNRRWSDLRFQVFDFVPRSVHSELPFLDRYRLLLTLQKHAWKSLQPTICLVQQNAFLPHVSVQQQLPFLMSQCSEQNQEGIVVRQKQHTYDRNGKRVKTAMFKVKL